MENRSSWKQAIAKNQNKPKKLEKYGLYLAKWAESFVKKTDSFGYVLGISGGIDSALAASILSMCKDTKLLGVFIDIESSISDVSDAKALAKKFKFELQYIDLTNEYLSLVQKCNIERNEIAKQNLKSRLRANALYALASKYGLLVCGTTNAAERLVGYYTKFGDSACDIALLSWLNKTQVRYLADYFDVPKKIINKAPSAGLKKDQTDEKDMGISYDEIDHYLSYAVIDPIQEGKINGRFVRNKHKLNAPVRPKKFMSFRNLK